MILCEKVYDFYTITETVQHRYQVILIYLYFEFFADFLTLIFLLQPFKLESNHLEDVKFKFDEFLLTIILIIK